MTNLVGPGQVDAGLKSEVTAECKKFGPVFKCVIKECAPGSVAPEHAVRIFVEFQNTQAAARARDTMNGRIFGGRAVNAEFYDQMRFKRGDLF
jgi:hypothetical protein